MNHATLAEFSQFLTSLLDGLQDTLSACAAQKKQCPMTCSQRKGFVEAANAIVAVTQQILEAEATCTSPTASSPPSPTLSDHSDTSTMAVLRRQLDAVRSDGELLQRFIHRYHPEAKLEPGVSPTITTSRVADLLKVKQTFRSLQINLHDVEQLLRILYNRVFETPETSPTERSVDVSSHAKAVKNDPQTAAAVVASLYDLILSEDTVLPAPHPDELLSRSPLSAGSTVSPALMGTAGLDTYKGVGVASVLPIAHAASADEDEEAPGRQSDVSGEGRHTRKLSTAVKPRASLGIEDDDNDEKGGREEEPEARPVDATLSSSFSAPPPRTSTGTLPYVRGSHSQALPSVSANRSDLDFEEDTTDGDFSGPRVSAPRRHEEEDEAEEEGLSSIAPRATARLFPSAHARPAAPAASSSSGTPPLHSSRQPMTAMGLPPKRADAPQPPTASATKSNANVPSVSDPPSLDKRKGRLITTQHSYRMPGELWRALQEEIPDEVEACFVEDVLNALNAHDPAAASERPAIGDTQIVDVRLAPLEQFLYIRFGVEHGRHDYPKKDIDARVADYTYPLMTALYEEAFRAQRAREEAELDQLDSNDEVFSDVVSSSQSRRGSSSQRRRDSVPSISSGVLGEEDQLRADTTPSGLDRAGSDAGHKHLDETSARDERDIKPMLLAVPTSVLTGARDGTPSVQETASTSFPSVSKTVSTSVLPSLEQTAARATHGSSSNANASTSTSSTTSTDTAGEYRVKMPGRHWPTVLFFISKPMIRHVLVQEISLATGVALKAIADMKLSIGSLCADFSLDASAPLNSASATDAPGVWPSCSEFVMRALESHDYTLIHEQYVGACRDLFLKNDLAEGTPLFANEVLGPRDVRENRHASAERAAAVKAISASEQATPSAPTSYFTLPTVDELDESSSSLPSGKRRPSATVVATTSAPAIQIGRASTGVRAGSPSASERPSSAYASLATAYRPDTPDNEPITLLHLALEHNLSVSQLRAYNPQLSHLGDHDAIPEDDGVTVQIPRPTWLYEEEDAALESVALGSAASATSGAPVLLDDQDEQACEAVPPSPTEMREGRERPVAEDAAASAESQPSATVPLSPSVLASRTGISSASAVQRSSAHNSASARQESVSSVASSTVSTPSSATARLRKRQKLVYVDPVVVPPPPPAPAPVSTIAAQQQPTAPSAAPVTEAPASTRTAPRERASTPSAAPPVIAHVTATYRHLTMPSRGTPHHPTANPQSRPSATSAATEGDTAAPEDAAVAAQVVPSPAIAEPPSVPSHTSASASATKTAPRATLLSLITRARPQGDVADTTGDNSSTGKPSSASTAPSASAVVPTRGHSNSPPHALSAPTASSARPPAAHVLPTATPTPSRPSLVLLPRAHPRAPALRTATPVFAPSPSVPAPPTVASVVVPWDGQPRLGIRLDKNLIIVSLAAHSAAAEGGMTVGAQLRTVNGKPVHSAEELQRLLRHAAMQPLPSVLLITTSRPSAKAQGAAWSEAEEATATVLKPSARDLKTHWIRLVSDGVEKPQTDDTHARTAARTPSSLPSPRGDRAPARAEDLAIHSDTVSPSPAATAARAAVYQRVRSHSTSRLAVSTGPRAASGARHRTGSAGVWHRRPRKDSMDELEQPAPRNAVPLPTPRRTAAESGPMGNHKGTGTKTVVRSRSARKGSQDV